MKGNPVAVFETSFGEIEAENLGFNFKHLNVETGKPATTTAGVQDTVLRLESSKDFLGSSAADSLEFH